VKYPDTRSLGEAIALLQRTAELKCEHGASTGARAILSRVERVARAATRELQRLPENAVQACREPNSLTAIRALRPSGPRRIWDGLDKAAYADRLEGALLARVAGCILGAPVEGFSIETMEDLAAAHGDNFPPTDYWTRVPNPRTKRYDRSPLETFTRGGMNGAPVDDDTTYTLLGLLAVEEHGPGFTVEQLGQTWARLVPVACTAEDVALRNLRKGVPAMRAGAKDNPYSNWIGADIRSDPWAYMAPGWPEMAADMAWRDASLTHRRTGIHGAMYFAAAIAAAFAVDDPVEALHIGLTEIPRDCWMAREVRWALSSAPQIRNFREARAAVDRRFPGMPSVHTINNACLTIWGVTIGAGDVSRTISETVAMGLDNDCTAATAGSIVGAVAGKSGVAAHWTRPFNGKILSYLKSHPRFGVADLVRRFARQARAVHGE
jgi:ADP-ribosylglycohydrolase